MPEEDVRAAGILPAVISEPLAVRLFPDGEPLGRHVTLRLTTPESTDTATIVGIVPGTVQDILDVPSQSQIYVPYGARYRAAMTLHVRVGAQVDEAAMVTTIERTLRRLDDQLPILTARTLTAQRDASIPRWAVRTAAMLFGALSAQGQAGDRGDRRVWTRSLRRRVSHSGVRHSNGAWGDHRWHRAAGPAQRAHNRGCRRFTGPAARGRPRSPCQQRALPREPARSDGARRIGDRPVRGDAARLLLSGSLWRPASLRSTPSGANSARRASQRVTHVCPRGCHPARARRDDADNWASAR